MKTQQPTNKQRWKQSLQEWTEPFPRVKGELNRVNARLLTRMIIIISGITVIVLPLRLFFVNPDSLLLHTTNTLLIIAFNFVSYILARLGFITAVMVLVGIFTDGIIVLMLLGSGSPQTMPLFFAATPIILVSGFFPTYPTLFATATQVVFVIITSVLMDGLNFNDVLTGPFTFLVILTVTLILAQRRREYVESFLNQRNEESNQRFRIAAEGSLDPYYILESLYDEHEQIIDFTIVDLNSRAEEQLKTPRNKAIGTRFFSYFPALEKVNMLERYQQVIESGETLVEDFELPLDSDIKEWYHHQVVRLATGLAVTNREITKEKQQSIELENRVNQLVGLNELARTMTSTIDVNKVYWLVFENFGKKLFNAQHMVIGIYNEQKKMISCAFRVNAGERADHREFPDIPIGTGPASQTVLTGKPRILSSQEYYTLYPTSLLRGGEIPIKSLLFLPLVVNDKSLGYISIQHEDDNAFANVDMSLMMTVANQAAIAIENARLFQQAQEQIETQHTIEQALRKSRAQYQLLAETARDIILTHDLDGQLLYANQAFLRLVGCSPDEISQCNIADFFPDSSKLIWLQESFRESVGDWEKILPKTIEVDMHLPDEIVPLEINTAVIQDTEGFQGMLLIARDISDRRFTEEALINSEENFRSLAEYSPDMIYIFQLPDYNLLYFNRDTFLGYPAVEIYEYNSVLPYTHPDDYERLIEHRDNTKKGKQDSQTDFEFRMRDSENNWQWIQSREVIMDHYENGAPSRIMVIFTVITERKEAEFELKRSEERFRAVINTQAEVISRYSVDLTLTFVNETYRRVFGLADVPMDEIIGRKIKDFIPESQHAYIDNYYAQLMATLEPNSSIHKTFAADGSERWYRWRDQPILDNEGNLLEFQATGIDITDQLEAEQALQRNDEIFRLITENVDIVFYVFDAIERRFTYVSPSYENIWGMPIERMYTEPKSYQENVHPDDIDVLRQAIEKQRNEKSNINMDYRVIHPEQGVHWVTIRDFLIFDNEQHTYTVGIVKDITEERRMNARMLEIAREQERLKMLKQFVGDTSHDLMTPLSVIKTSLYLLNKSKDEDSRAKRTAVINEQIELLVEMIGDMLDMSRLDDPTTANYEFQAVDINAFIENIVDDHRTLALQSSHHISVDYSPNLPRIQGDQKKLRRAISNLIGNALKYTPSGSKIHVSTYSKQGGVGITVEDNGEGIPKEAVPRVFERFFRVEQHRPSGNKKGGTGLGLAITKSIIDGHGGSVTIESDVGKGTTFNIWLPLHDNTNNN